jgi:hypothetical protein
MPESASTSWPADLVEAKRAALARLSPEQKAEREAAVRGWRERRAERKREALDHMRQIITLFDTGHTASEIGAKVGRAALRVAAFAAARGVTISRSELMVRYAVPVSVKHRTALRALAAKHGVMDDVQLLCWLVACCLDHDGQIAKFVTRNPDGAREALARAFTAKVA